MLLRIHQMGIHMRRPFNPFELPANSRVYLVAGTQHGGTAGMRPTLGTCTHLRNPHSPNPALRSAALRYRKASK